MGKIYRLEDAGIKVILRLVFKGGKDRMYLKGTSTRFIQRIKAVGWVKCFIRVEYGMGIDQDGKKVMFYNEGEYTSRKEALSVAQKAFNEGLGIVTVHEESSDGNYETIKEFK